MYIYCCVLATDIYTVSMYIHIYMQSYITSLCAVACQKAAAFMWFYVGFFLSMRKELASNVVFTPDFAVGSPCNLAGFVLYSQFCF